MSKQLDPCTCGSGYDPNCPYHRPEKSMHEPITYDTIRWLKIRRHYYRDANRFPKGLKPLERKENGDALKALNELLRKLS